jgi:tetratricopeptide (TPR) repeat protein
MAMLAGELRQPSQDWNVAAYRALLALLDGRLAQAEALIEVALGLGERAQGWHAALTFKLQLYVLRREQRRLDEIERLVRESVEEYRTYPAWRCVLVQMLAELSQEAEAKSALEALAVDGFAGVPFDEWWLVSMSRLAEAASNLDDRRHAASLYERLLPYRDRVAVTYSENTAGSVARYLGLLAATMGRWEAAERHLGQAMAVNEKAGARPWLAHTQRDLGRMLLERGGNASRARELLSESCQTYRTLGMESWADEASRLIPDSV